MVKKDDTYRAARADAQRRANDTGYDHRLEWNQPFQQWMIGMLPGKQYRAGHELRCEVVSCENLAKCQNGHGP